MRAEEEGTNSCSIAPTPSKIPYETGKSNEEKAKKTYRTIRLKSDPLGNRERGTCKRRKIE